MNWNCKEMLSDNSIANIKKAINKIAKEREIAKSEIRNDFENRRFNVFDFVNEFGEDVSEEQAYDFISEYCW